MSASLVGSEMCIRDSTGTQRAERTGSAPGTHRDECAGSAPETHREERACLLYTSDAADDM
eukprot:6451894-Alexandrium_andersonii.AAC.1